MVAWLVGTTSALAAVPVTLPPAEDPTVWSSQLAIAGLEAGDPGEGPWVVLSEDGTRWQVKVKDRAGEIRTAVVDAPQDATGREELVWLAASLLHPLSTPPPPQDEPVAVEDPPPAPRSLLRPPPPEPEPEPEIEPIVLAEPVVESVETVDAPASSSGWPMRFHGGPGVVVGGPSSSAMGVGGGVRLTSPAGVRLGLDYLHTARSELVELATPGSFDSHELRAGLGWSGPAAHGASVAGELGIAWRNFEHEGSPLDRVWVPVAAVEGDWAVPIAFGISVVPNARLLYDLRATRVTEAGQIVARMGRVGGYAGLALAWSADLRPMATPWWGGWGHPLIERED